MTDYGVNNWPVFDEWVSKEALQGYENEILKKMLWKNKIPFHWVNFLVDLRNLGYFRAIDNLE